AAGQFSPGETRNYRIRGTSGFSGQGGTAGGRRGVHPRGERHRHAARHVVLHPGGVLTRGETVGGPGLSLPAMAPAAPEPTAGDDKDWTWTAERACPDCGFDPGTVTDTGIAAQLRA